MEPSVSENRTKKMNVYFELSKLRSMVNSPDKDIFKMTTKLVEICKVTFPDGSILKYIENKYTDRDINKEFCLLIENIIDIIMGKPYFPLSILLDGFDETSEYAGTKGVINMDGIKKGIIPTPAMQLSSLLDKEGFENTIRVIGNLYEVR